MGHSPGASHKTTVPLPPASQRTLRSLLRSLWESESSLPTFTPVSETLSPRLQKVLLLLPYPLLRSWTCTNIFFSIILTNRGRTVRVRCEVLSVSTTIHRTWSSIVRFHGQRGSRSPGNSEEFLSTESIERHQSA